MEAVGAGANLLAFVLLALKCAKESYNILSEIKDAPSNVQGLANDIRFLQSILERFSKFSKLQLRVIPTHEATAFDALVRNCYEEISAIAKWLRPIYTFPSDNRARKVVKRMYASLKEKDIDRKRKIVHGQSVKLNLYLSLLQSYNRNQPENTANLLEKIMNEVERIHSRLDNVDPVEINADVGVVAGESEAGCELEQSIARLGELVDHNECTLDAEDAQQIIDDLQTLLSSTRDPKWKRNNDEDSPTPANTVCGVTAPDDDELRRDIRLAESVTYASPVIDVNKTWDRDQLIVSAAREAMATRRYIHHSDNRIGTLTFRITKSRAKGKTPHTDPGLKRLQRQRNRRHIAADIIFRPHRSTYSFKLFICQAEVMVRTTSQILRLSVNPIRPMGSLVFKLVQEGSLAEFKALLVAGEASLRDHDETGQSLLHYGVQNPEMCQFLLEHGLDVDEVGGNKLFTPMLGLFFTETAEITSKSCMELLLKREADPTIAAPYYISPFRKAAVNCSEDKLKLIQRLSPHLAAEEVMNDAADDSSMLLWACEASLEGHEVNKTSLSILLSMGARIDSRITGGMLEPAFGLNSGATCLHSIVKFARFPSDLAERDALLLLIQKGAEVRAVDDEGRSVSQYAYIKGSTYFTRHAGLSWDDAHGLGGYRGDLWDASLAVCGFDLYEFRKIHPRKPRYGTSYTRQHFENLWKGYEHKCPYWDDERYPPSEGDSDYWYSDGFQFSSDEELDEDDVTIASSDAEDSLLDECDIGGVALSQGMQEDWQ